MLTDADAIRPVESVDIGDREIAGQIMGIPEAFRIGAPRALVDRGDAPSADPAELDFPARRIEAKLAFPLEHDADRAVFRRDHVDLTVIRRTGFRIKTEPAFRTV